jgi:hypothetical protein
MLSLSKVYEGILKSMQYDVDETGLVSILTPTGTKAEATVGGARLVVPTQKRLRDGFTEDLQPYHPLCESLSRRGTSPVLQHMQRSVKQHLGFLVSFLADALVKMSLNTSIHKDLPPDMSDVLMKLTGVTDKTQAILDKLIPAAHKQNKLITVYLKGPGTFQGQKVNRIAVIRFPILDELDNDADKDMVLGVKIPAKQRKVISGLLRLIVPFGDSPEEYSAGTISRVAPFFTAFLQAYHKIATRMNQSINRFAGPLALPLKPIELFPLEWIDQFASIYNQIPSLNGNDGGTDEVAEETQAAPQPQQRQQQNPVMTPTLSGNMPQIANMFAPQQANTMVPQQQRPAAASAPQNQKPKQTVADLMRGSAPQMPQMQGYMQQPQQMYPQQQYPQQQMVNQYGQIIQQPMMPQMNSGGQAQLPWVMQQQQQMQPQNPYMQVFTQPQMQQQQPQMMQYGQYPQQQMFQQPQQVQYGSNGL